MVGSFIFLISFLGKIENLQALCIPKIHIFLNLQVYDIQKPVKPQV